VATYKEIVTKAVIGKGKKTFKNSYSLTTEIEPTTVLGCWIVNHTFKGVPKDDKVAIDGSFDVNVWYAHDNDTKTNVSAKRITYNEVVSVKIKEDSELSDESDIIIRSLKQPNCTKVEIKDGDIYFDVEKELGIEIVGDTKVKVMVEEEDDNWDVIEEDEVNAEIEKEIDEGVKENYI
jgi:spore coat protein E